MSKPCRGWDHGSQARPASEYDIRYGSELLKDESSKWPSYIVVSTPRAYKAAQPDLSQQPAGVAYAAWLDSEYLKELSDGLPNGAELVIGLGGGRALDAAKCVALEKNLSLILVPTLVSTGAIIHGVFARWDGRKIIGWLDDWPWIDCEYVLVDYDLVQRAPHYLNTAGLGDVLCGYAGVAEWRRSSKLGIDPPCDEEVVAALIEYHEELVGGFLRTLDDQGSLTAESVRFIVTALQERDSKALRHLAAPSGDHLFLIALELVNDKCWIHGEVVALGAVIIAWQCDECPEALISRLDRCRVRHRPTQMGISREELSKGLEFVPSFMAEMAGNPNANSIMCHKPVTGAKFDALWEFLETK